MSIYETIGYIWVIFSAMFGTIVFFICAYKCLRLWERQQERGAIEEQLDIRRQAEQRFLEGLSR